MMSEHEPLKYDAVGSYNKDIFKALLESLIEIIERDKGSYYRFKIHVEEA